MAYTRDDEVKALLREFRYETDDELERKRGVFRTFIVRHEEEQQKIARDAGDIDYNRRRYDVLSKIIRRRQWWKAAREVSRHFVLWLGPLAPFILGVWGGPTVRSWIDSLM